MYQPREPFQPAGPATQTALPTILTPSQVLDVFRRQWPLIASIAGAIVLLVAAYVLTASPRFTANARILMDTRQNQLLEKQNIVGSALIDTGIVDSQVELLTSENLLSAVVRNYNLVSDPEFNPPRGPLAALLSYLSFSDDGPPSEERRVQKVVEAMQRNLKVDRVGTTYVLSVSYTALDARKAALIANAIADAYIVGGLEAKYESTKRAGQWLQARSVELRDAATRADRAVQTFKSQNNIVGTSRGLMSDQELTDVTSQLTQAKAATAEAKARLDRIKVVNDKDLVQSTVSDALNNPVITRLRAQYLDLSAQYADWSGRYGANHQAAINLSNRMGELRKSIQDEVKRISDAYQSDYEIARSREQSLQNDLDALVKRASSSSQLQVELRNLESAADTSRTLYNNFLEKLQQATQQETFPITDARIITTAVPPDRKSSPKTLLLLAVGSVIGLLLGTGSAFARELMNDVFRTPGDVEDNLGLKCLGILPKVPAAASLDPRGGDGSNSRSRMSNFVVENPFSRYAETLRNIKVSIDVAQMNRQMKVIGIVSSLPKEGKTTVSANLGHLVAMTGHRTIVIDGDLHTCSLTRTLAPDAKVGLLEALADPANCDRFVCSAGSSKLHVLPAVIPQRMINSADVMASNAMAKLLHNLRERYDYIFIDLAPLMPVTDAKATNHLLDGMVYVIEWGQTRRSAVIESIGGADEVYDKVVGAVLNRAETGALRRIEGYKGAYYNRYYVEK
ncbi:GNVR domain-containing protein [Bosea sp. ASV33]|uniref:GNVR domain-containing protein n=1 Tax=Bosea sp. ASV33 TaxID=2795106 RepID=UPI0018ED79F4|nr:GNVR domain-containing protein [Bosea sp. ASV33]